MLVRWWRRIGIGSLLGRWRLCNSGAFARQCCRVVGIGTLVGWCHCHGVGTGTVLEERDLTINLRGGRRGEGGGGGDRSMMSSMLRGLWHFGGDVAVHRVVLLGGGRPYNGQRARRQRHLGGRCGASGGVVGGEAAVQDTVEAVGRKGGAMDHAGVVGRSA
jgi:hypothetical protein